MIAGPSIEAATRVRPRQAGFTLLELLVTVAIVAVLAALAVPSFTGLFNNNRLTAQSNELVTSLQLARAEAIRRNTSISLCRTTDGATCAGAAGAWTNWLTVDGAGAILRRNEVKPPLQLSSNGGLDRITFRADGLARTAAGALLNDGFSVCVANANPAQNKRAVAIQSGSRISTQPAGNGAGTCP